MSKRVIGMALLSAALLVACAHKQSPIAIVDTQRLAQFWPKFQNYNNQLSVDMQTIDRSRTSEDEKTRERAALQQKYGQIQSELTKEVRNAATQVARVKNFQLVVTRQYVGYGGTDITPDVEQILKITETSPSPHP
jgi:Skp family chaperone for outer membrane proteins